MLILYYVLYFSHLIHILQALHGNTECTKVILKPDKTIITEQNSPPDNLLRYIV